VKAPKMQKRAQQRNRVCQFQFLSYPLVFF
jgi:hypothetical protein